jgi:hypothetical protein
MHFRLNVQPSFLLSRKRHFDLVVFIVIRITVNGFFCASRLNVRQANKIC